MIASVAVLVVVDDRTRTESLRGRDVALVRAPYALNLGWIVVAFLLNTAQFLHAVARYDGAPLTPIGFAVLLAIVGGVAGLWLVARRENPFAALAVAWGLAAIAAYQDDVRSLATVAGVLAAAVAALAIWQLVDHGRHHILPRRWRLT
jgi:hypothetical protein